MQPKRSRLRRQAVPNEIWSADPTLPIDRNAAPWLRPVERNGVGRLVRPAPERASAGPWRSCA
jgi:hypothetical protein